MIIQVQHLTHRYGDRVALSDVSLAIGQGEIFGFLGPNGSGKTTLFRVLSTLLQPSEGEVTIADRNLRTERGDIRRQIGVVFQAPSLDKQLTAAENLRHHAHLYGLRGAGLESRINLMLSRVGLDQRPSQRVDHFSGGMRRRVEIAKGLLTEPKILLLDEPSTGLDPSARLELWRYLRQIRDATKTTILVTTHLMDEAEQCDRLAILDAGKLAACDTPSALKARIGKDVLTLTTTTPSELADQIRVRFQLDAQVLDGVVRIERERGHELIPTLIEAFIGQIQAVSVGKPTLEDVFVHLTGRNFDAGRNG